MSRKHNAPTMRDVAEVAGVSVQTVSAVVNNKSEISSETRQRVLEVIEELGYRRGSIARSLRTGKTNTIALVVSDIANPSFSTMASAAEDYAHYNGYNLEVYNTHDDIKREVRYIQRAIERWIDGMLFVSAEDRMTSLEKLQSAGIPTVAVDRIPESYTGPSVTLDNEKAGRIAAEHLLDLGHMIIGHISGPQHLRLARERKRGFHKAIEARGLVPIQSIHAQNNWDCESGYQTMLSILERDPRPTAIFCANDRMAIGAMQAIGEGGMNVPDDISVIGLDDIEVAAFITPPITTVKQSFSGMAEIGMQLLLQLLEGQELTKKQVLLDPKLIIRKSTAPPRQSRRG